MSPPIEQLTTEGYDMQFGVNAVGTALFTSLLLPLLRAATRSSFTTASSNSSTSNEHASRVVFTSSLGHMAASSKEPIAWDTLKPIPGSAGEEKRKKIGPDGLYYQSKVVRLVMALILSYALFGSSGDGRTSPRLLCPHGTMTKKLIFSTQPRVFLNRFRA